MVHYKLTYFDVRGLAEVSRLILHYAGVEFEDKRITHDEWPAIKPSTPFGQVPVLEVEGVKLSQSHAIARYLARKYNLVGKDDFESAVLDSYADLIKDTFTKTLSHYNVLLGRTEGDKEKATNEVTKVINELFPYFEKRISSSDSGYIAKSGISWVDFFLMTFSLTLENYIPGVLKKFTAVNELIKRVNELPQLKSYFSSQKSTQI